MINYKETVKLKPYDEKEHDQTNTSYILTIVLHEQNLIIYMAITVKCIAIEHVAKEY